MDESPSVSESSGHPAVSARQSQPEPWVDVGPTLWARCSALLTRQALETALDDFWRQLAPEVEHASRHSQLLCLGSYLGEPPLAAGVAHVWSALSNACLLGVK